MKWSKLLERQLSKYAPPQIIDDPGCERFLHAVNDSYLAYERDLELSERAFRISEEEYQSLNGRLSRELGNKQLSIVQLQDAVVQLTGSELAAGKDELLDILDVLKTEMIKRRKVEAELADTANRLALLIANLQAGVLVEDEHRTAVLANASFCRMFNIAGTPLEMVGRDCEKATEESSSLFKDPAALVARIHQLIRQQVPVVNDELELADGRVYERDYIPLFMDGVYRGHLWQCRDVTMRVEAANAVKKNEEKYRNIIDNMNLGLVEVDTLGIIRFTNQCFCEMSGYQADELMGQDPSLLFYDEAQARLLTEKGLLRENGVSDVYELEVRNKRGEPKWWLISGAPNYDDGGRFTGSIGIHLDITEHKQLEYELSQARIAAEESSRVKEAFLANMSHEMRTPMNAIINMCRQLARTQLDNRQRILLDTIDTASEHLLVVINDILDISKIEAGKLELETIPFRIYDMLKNVLLVVQPKADEKGLLLKLEVSSQMHPVLTGDPHRISQVLLNLLSNSIKFTDRGTVTLQVTPSGMKDGRQTIVFSVRDTGAGMDAEFLKKVFDKFSQQYRDTARKSGGTGLGMAICKQLVELMDGQISIFSEMGVGTEVTFWLSLETSTDAAVYTIDTEMPDKDALKGSRILMAEDNIMNRLVVRTILEAYQVELTEVENGYEAVRQLKVAGYDVVLMDVQMPVMNGYEATALIRRELKLDVPIIALTANAIKGESDRCIEAGMTGFVSKPFEENALIREIAISLQKNQLRRPASQSSDPQTAAPETLYDLAKLRKINDNTGFITQMVRMFRQQAVVSATEIRQAVDAGNWPAVRAAIHKVRPSVDAMGIAVLEADLLDLEQHAADNDASRRKLQHALEVLLQAAEQLRGQEGSFAD
ncbi:ATP-binding protein [Chitinophaga caseinilytica]|uniref:ATP-binding protein n=1 Tax=Chitinophaga caseinilytica TaxID=2267521 RepID=UPI003C2C6EF9